MDETLIYFGGEIKALGDGRIEGYLIRFGSPTDTDLAGDYFAPDVDIDYYEGKQISLYYNHAMDPVLKNRKIGTGTLRNDGVGYWLQGQMAMRDEYEKAVYGMVEAGKIGFSSGSAPHLVERKNVSGASEIKAWPVIEASLTPAPCEKRNMVYPLKSLIAAQSDPAPRATSAPAEETVLSESGETLTLKGLQDFIDNEAAETRQLFADHSETVVSAAQEFAQVAASFAGAAKAYAQRAKDKAEFRAVKDGRMISQANIAKMNAACERIKTAMEHMNGVHGDLMTLVDAATPKKQEDMPAILSASSERLRKLRVEYARTQAAALGIAV